MPGENGGENDRVVPDRDQPRPLHPRRGATGPADAGNVGQSPASRRPPLEWRGTSAEAAKAYEQPERATRSDRGYDPPSTAYRYGQRDAEWLETRRGGARRESMDRRGGTRRRTGSSKGMNPLLPVVVALAIVAAGATAFAMFAIDRGSDSAQVVDAESVDERVADIRLLLQGIGYSHVAIENRDGVIHVSGALDTQADVAAVITAVTSLADQAPVNTDGLIMDPAETPTSAESDAASSEDNDGRDPPRRLQVTLNRIVATAPVIFPPGAAGLSDWHGATLDRVADAVGADPGLAIAIVGYTDDTGSVADNESLSLQRAEVVREYLIDKGVPAGRLTTEARGESGASGLRDISYLERRVEFEVVGAALDPIVVRPLNIGVIVPSAADDNAFSQSLVDALAVLEQERGELNLDIIDNVFDVDAASEEVRRFVEEGNDVIILHGAQFRPIVEELAADSPDVVFVTGPNPLASELDNVFVYTVAAEQGAYVLGDLAGALSSSKTIGVVGPIPAPEPVLYVEGFKLGAEQQGAEVLIEYAGSFGDTDLAAEIAEAHVAAGADILTGTAQLTAGAIPVASDQGLPWFANQANQSSLAPDDVVASQVYHFEVAIREILAEVDAGATTGGSFPLTLGNGGMLLEFNPQNPVDPALRSRADELLFGVTAGSISVEVEVGDG